MTNAFNIDEVIKFGWSKMKQHFWFFAGLVVIVLLVQIVPTIIERSFEDKGMIYFLLTLVVWVIQIIIKMGIIRINLDIIDRDEGQLESLFSGAELLGKFILGAILYGLIVFVGLILLIIPGIIWGIKYQYFAYLIVDKNLGPLEALKKSSEITSGNKWNLFLLGLMLFLINVVGFICLVVGLFVTVPIAMVAEAYVYRKLMGEIVAPDSSQPAATQEAVG